MIEKPTRFIFDVLVAQPRSVADGAAHPNEEAVDLRVVRAVERTECWDRGRG